MIGEVGDHVVVLHRLLVEHEVSTENVFTDEEVTISKEQSSILFLSDLSSVLNGAAHLLHGFPLVFTVLEEASTHMLFHVEHRGIQVRGIELVRHGETDGSELSSLLDNRVQEADGESKGSPFFIRLDLLNEVLVDHGVISSVHTSLHSLWWL